MTQTVPRDSLSIAQRMADEHGQPVAIIRRDGLWDGDRVYTGHDCATYAWCVEQEIDTDLIETWVDPEHGTPSGMHTMTRYIMALIGVGGER